VAVRLLMTLMIQRENQVLPLDQVSVRLMLRSAEKPSG
jgi:hypothetical protein